MSIFSSRIVGHVYVLSELVSLQNLKCLADVVDKLAVSDLLDWTDRTKLINGLCDIIALSPPVGQVMSLILLLLCLSLDFGTLDFRLLNG